MCGSSIDVDRLLRETFLARVEYHPTIGSTNDRARQCAAEGSQPLPLLIVADVQTAGRGRGSNRWWTGRGSLAFTLLLDLATLGVPRRCWSLVGLAAGVAVVESVAPCLPSHRVGICWPNDVCLAGRKLAGILVEVFGDRLHAIGIGLNHNNSVAEAPAELKDTVVTMLDLTGAPRDATASLAAIVRRFEHSLRQLAVAPEEIGARADSLCLQRGQELSLQTGNRLITGRCAGIATDGALLLDTPAGREKFFSGTLVPRRKDEGRTTND